MFESLVFLAPQQQIETPVAEGFGACVIVGGQFQQGRFVEVAAEVLNRPAGISLLVELTFGVREELSAEASFPSMRAANCPRIVVIMASWPFQP